MKAALDAGVKLYYWAGMIDFNPDRIYAGESPYSVTNLITGDSDSVKGLWSHFADMEIEVKWEDELEKRPILCWVSDKRKDERVSIRPIKGVGNGFYIPGIWKYATPCTEAEIEKFIL